MIIRTINAFLNAGKGGTILLGIADDGEIKGFSLSLQQVCHAVMNGSTLLIIIIMQQS